MRLTETAPVMRCRVSAAIAAGIAALLLVRQPTAKEFHYPTFKFDSLEMHKYRLELVQVKQDSGITSGFFFAYGHYVIPPYVVTARDGSTFVNGILVYPPIERGRPPIRPNVPDVPPTNDPWWAASDHLWEVEMAANRLYDSVLRMHNDTARAIGRTKAFLLADSLVDSAKVSSRGFSVYGRRSLIHGRYLPIRHEVEFGGPPGPPSDTTGQWQSRQRLAEMIAGSIGQGLLLGRCGIRGWGADADRGAHFASAICALMSGDSLTSEQLWAELWQTRTCSPWEAYGYVANRTHARAEWLSLKKRLRGGR